MITGQTTTDSDFEEMLAGFDRLINDKELQQELLDAGLLTRVPRTEAGRSLLRQWAGHPNEEQVRIVVTAIEDQAAAIERGGAR